MAEYINGVETLVSPVVSGGTISDATITLGTLEANNGTMTVKRRTTAQRTAMTPASGEPVWDTDRKQLYIGDGLVSGGLVVGNYCATANEIALGTTGLGSNTAAYGNSSITKHVFIGGNVGIGISSPTAELHVVPLSSSDIVFRTQSLQSTAPLGSELVTNGTFESDSGWTWGTGWSYDATNKEADHATGNTEALTQSISVTNGTTYQVLIQVKNRTAGSVTLDVNGVYIYDYGSTTGFTSNITYDRSLVANTTGSVTLRITPSSDFNGSVDNISVKAITGVSQPNFSLVDDAGSVMAEIRGKNSLSNFALGVNALRVNTTGSYNSAVGVNALYSNTTGYFNSAVGVNAIYSNTTGFSNSAIGVGAIYFNTTGYWNSAVGAYALYSNTTGYQNSALGRDAGRYISGGGANQTSNNSVYLGHDTRALANGDTNEIVIGASAIGAGSNSVVLGNDSITKTVLKGNVGFGTTSPTAVADINSDILRLRTAKTPASATATGNQGDICWDSSYVYVCVATNTWKRAALSTW